MANTASLKKVYAEQIAPALMKKFNYSSPMQIPVLKKIVINEGLGSASQDKDKKIVDKAIEELTAITGQRAVATLSKKDIAKGRAPAVTPPSEDVKKQFYQNDDALQNAPVQQPAPSNTVTEPQNDQYSQQDDVSDGTEVLYAETSVLSNKTDDIKPVEFDPNEPSIPIRIIKEIMVVHTDEVIPLT